MASKTQAFIKVMAFAVGLLSVAAAVPKILQMPQELGFLGSLGLSGITVSALGVVQLAGGILLFLSRFRLIGASLATLALLVSSLAIFASGDSTFGLISTLPLVVSIMLIIFELKAARRQAVK